MVHQQGCRGDRDNFPFYVIFFFMASLSFCCAWYITAPTYFRYLSDQCRMLLAFRPPPTLTNPIPLPPPTSHQRQILNDSEHLHDRHQTVNVSWLLNNINDMFGAIQIFERKHRNILIFLFSLHDFNVLFTYYHNFQHFGVRL